MSQLPLFQKSGRSILLAGLLTALLPPMAGPANAAVVDGSALGIVCEMNQLNASADPNTITVDFTLFNTSPSTVRLLKWNTVFAGNAGEVFEVRRDGEPISYQGPLVKRGTPVDDDFLLIQPEQRASETYDLTTYYDLSLPGNYTVNLAGPLRDLSTADLTGQGANPSLANLMTGSLDCGSVTVTVTPGMTLATPEQEDGVQPEIQPPSLQGITAEAFFETAQDAALPPVYNQCSATEKATVRQSHSTAYDGLLRSYRQLANDPTSGNELYGTWFGAFNATRLATVRTNYSDMSVVAASQGFTYYCKPAGCSSSSTIAYTYKGSRRIYLCNAFWGLSPDTGFDTQAGTIVHEMSHAVSYTDDIVYGTTRARALARTDPAQAVINADNYEYFTEDGGF